LLCALAWVLLLVQPVMAADNQTVNILISKLLKDYAMKTDFGNVYFSQKDLHRLIHGAAYLRPVQLGDIQSDQGIVLAVKTLGYDKGIVTIYVAKKK
jgi:hypothetical protein